MKIKILRNVALGMGCLMLTLTLSSNLLGYKSHNNKHINVTQMDEGSPFALHINVIQMAEGSPFARIQSKHIIRFAEGMPYGSERIQSKKLGLKA